MDGRVPVAIPEMRARLADVSQRDTVIPRDVAKQFRFAIAQPLSGEWIELATCRNRCSYRPACCRRRRISTVGATPTALSSAPSFFHTRTQTTARPTSSSWFSDPDPTLTDVSRSSLLVSLRHVSRTLSSCLSHLSTWFQLTNVRV